MLAIVATSFDRPSETFIQDHVKYILPGRTVLLCNEDGGAAEYGCPILCDLRPLTKGNGPAERIANSIRFRWRRYVDPTLRGQNEARVRSFLLRHKVKVVLAEFGPTGCLVRTACNRAGVPFYVHFHGFDATKLSRVGFWRRHYRALFRDAAGIIVPSKFLASRLLELGCSQKKIHVSPNGVNYESFGASDRIPGRFLAVGRLVEKKAPHLTIRAFAKVRDYHPDCSLDIVGDGPLQQACIEEIDRHNLVDHVRLHGAQGPEVVRQLLKNAAVFVQHSVTAADGDMESFGISLVEAMASSVPVVATNHNGFSETVEDGVTGLLVAENDVDGMAKAMISLIENRKMASAMGCAGRMRVESLFKHDQTASRLRGIMGLSCYD